LLIPVTELAFHQQLSRLLSSLDTPLFWQRLAQCLGEVVQFDNWVVMLFRPNRPPLVLADHHANGVAEDMFADYKNDIYLLDPFFQFIANQQPQGLFRLDEVAPEDFRQTEYFRRYFLINIVEDEVQFLAQLPGVGTVSLSLGKIVRFDQQAMGSLALYKDWVIELMRLHCRRNLDLADDIAVPELDVTTRFEMALAQKGVPTLTKREMEIALLILSGFSNKGIAKQLMISMDTVKVHRRNIYLKLDITTQSALFMMLMDVNVNKPG
jgi:DNA-binding CsgD family transcriptional regulator